MDYTILVKNYLREVLMCSSKWNLNYYVKITEGLNLKGREACIRLKEYTYDNSSTQRMIAYVNNAYQRLESLIETGDLKVSDNLKGLISDTIKFLAEDARNAEKLSSSGVVNADEIKDFSIRNIERLRRILQLC